MVPRTSNKFWKDRVMEGESMSRTQRNALAISWISLTAYILLVLLR